MVLGHTHIEQEPEWESNLRIQKVALNISIKKKKKPLKTYCVKKRTDRTPVEEKNVLADRAATQKSCHAYTFGFTLQHLILYSQIVC